MSDTICGLRFTLRKEGGVEKAAPSDVRNKITASATGSAKGEETSMAALLVDTTFLCFSLKGEGTLHALFFSKKPFAFRGDTLRMLSTNLSSLQSL